MVYEVLLAVGVLGFIAMVLAGMVHGHGGSGEGHAHAGAHGHADLGAHGHGGAHGHADMGSHGHAATNGHAHGTQGHHSDADGSGKSFRSWLAISPLDLFTMALGAGATGMAFSGMLQGAPLAVAAIVGALVFDFLLVKPLIKLIFKFSSNPSEGLEGQLASTAEAMCAFDGSGKGVVKLTMDGQIVQLLAQLEAPEISGGVQVRKGDTVVITDVDPSKGTCKVTRELSD